MKKIPNLFQRDWTTGLVIDQVTPGCEWVALGEGKPTYKFDGTSCMMQAGKLFKRYDAKAFSINRATGEKTQWNKKLPENFAPAQEPDENTGHWPGWVPVGDGPEDKWHREALEFHGELPDGTYELCGPQINANPESLRRHLLFRHGKMTMDNAPRCFIGLRDYFEHVSFEGLVFHHPDGRMCKAKRKDFWTTPPPIRFSFAKPIELIGLGRHFTVVLANGKTCALDI